MNEKNNGRRGRKVMLYVAASVVATGIIAAITIAVLHAVGAPKNDKPTSRQAASQPATGPKVLQFDEKNAQLLEKGLNSSSKTEQARAMMPALREGQWSSAKVLPDGATLTIDRQTFIPAKNGQSATVDAVVTGSIDARFVLQLAPFDGQWLLYATQRTK